MRTALFIDENVCCRASPEGVRGRLHRFDDIEVPVFSPRIEIPATNTLWFGSRECEAKTAEVRNRLHGAIEECIKHQQAETLESRGGKEALWSAVYHYLEAKKRMSRHIIECCHAGVKTGVNLSIFIAAIVMLVIFRNIASALPLILLPILISAICCLLVNRVNKNNYERTIKDAEEQLKGLAPDVYPEIRGLCFRKRDIEEAYGCIMGDEHPEIVPSDSAPLLVPPPPLAAPAALAAST